MNRLFVINRMDCEDEMPEDTPLEQLIPGLMKMQERGFPLPTLMVRCAGKNDRAIVNSPSSMRAFKTLADHGAFLGLHVHCRLDDRQQKIFADYHDSQIMKQLLRRGVDIFRETFGFSPTIFGMGDIACSNTAVASLLSGFGITLNISDFLPNKYRMPGHIISFDYRPSPWQSELPIRLHDVWWIPFGSDGQEGDALHAPKLQLLNEQGDKEFCTVFEHYRGIAQMHPDKPVIIGSIVHPPETIQRWDHWVIMHELAREYGFTHINANQVLDILNSQYKA